MNKCSFCLSLLLLLLTIPVHAVVQTGTIVFDGNCTMMKDNLGNLWSSMTDGDFGISNDGSCYKTTNSSYLTLTHNFNRETDVRSVSIVLAGATTPSSGTVALRVNTTDIGTGSFSGTNQVTVSSTDSHADSYLTIQITSIKGFVKVYSITYSYDDGNPSTYTRSNLTPGALGTICLPYATSSTSGATFYTVAGVTQDANGVTNGIAFDEVNGQLQAGVPYLFQATSNELTATFEGRMQASAQPTTGMVGNLSASSLTVPTGYYILKTDGFLHIVQNGTHVTVGQYKAYFNLENLLVVSPENTPGRVIMDMAAPQEPETATALAETFGAENVQKIIRNGQLVIIKNGVFFNALGQIIQ